jgi:hypothetical protein
MVWKAALKYAVLCRLQSKSILGLNTKKKKKGLYQKREGREENGYTLNRFDPVMLDIVEDAANNKLSNDNYPWVR